MSLSAKAWPLYARQHSALSRMLVYFPESNHAEVLIQFAVQLARHYQARLRGLTVIDTSQLEEFATTCESAAYAAFEQQRLEQGDALRDQVRARFSQSCLSAGLDFDLHRERGQTLQILRSESKFQDLSLTSLPSPGRQHRQAWKGSDVVKMVWTCISPLLVLRDSSQFPQRVLLVQDGSPASSRTLRSFLSQQLFPEAATRLLAIGSTASVAKQTLWENLDSVCGRWSNVETGYAVGRPAQVIPEYVQQWEADLVVLGAERKTPVIGNFLAESVSAVLKKTSAALYSTC